MNSFVGGRLTEAREARGITQMSLADILGIRRSAISAYETSQTLPSPEVVAIIAGRLNLPVRFFLRPVEDRETDVIFFCMNQRSPK